MFIFDQTIAHLNKLGGVIASGVYLLVIGMAIIIVLHRLAAKLIYPRLQNKRRAKVIIGTLYVLVMVTAALVFFGQLGFDVSVFGPVSVVVVIFGAAVISYIAPFLPSLPFKKGALVEIGGAFGHVRSMSAFYTRILTFDGKTVFIPNATIWSARVVNYNYTADRRIDLMVRVKADSDLARARELLLEIMRGDDRVLGEPAPSVFVLDAKAEGVDMAGYCWVKNADWFYARSDLLEKLVSAAQSGGVALALAKQEIVLSGEAPRA